MDNSSRPRRSQLFTVRIWPDASGQMAEGWRGKVYHVQGGSWHYFRDWETLVAFLNYNSQAMDENFLPECKEYTYSHL